MKAGINGASTFAPDGNPLVGPVPGKRACGTACAVMAGFLQGGGVGKSLAEWIIHGAPEADVYGMDIARFSTWADNKQDIKQTNKMRTPTPTNQNSLLRIPSLLTS